MLALPQFLLPENRRHAPVENATSPLEAIASGFELSSWFLERNVYGPRGIKPPDERAGFMKKILVALEQETGSDYNSDRLDKLPETQTMEGKIGE